MLETRVTRYSRINAPLKAHNNVAHDLEKLVHLGEHWQLFACLQNLLVLPRMRLLGKGIDLAILLSINKFSRFGSTIPEANSPSPSLLALLLHVAVRTHTKALLRRGQSSSSQLLADEGVDERGMGCPVALK